MEPTSQIFSQGGILSKDWFSDKLQNKEKYRKQATKKAKRQVSQMTDCFEPCFNRAAANLALPNDLFYQLKFLLWQS